MSQIKKTMGHKESTKKLDTEYLVTEPMGLLDFLLLNLTNKSRNNVKSLLTNKEILVDGNPISQYDFKLKTGQKIQISRSLVRGNARNFGPDIIYEDHDIIVINKPAGLLSIATEKEKELTAYHLVTEYVQLHNPKSRIFSVHRLDRDTSGVLMFARSERIKLALQDNWSKLVSNRGYVAIVEGNIKEKSGRIHSWLKETKTLIMYSCYTVGDGLEAITNYKVIRENSQYSLLDINLETGRKNQIRVHMKDIGHCVVGDKKYGAHTDPIRRLGLHANKLMFTHPFTEKILTFEAPVPKKFNAFFDNHR